MFSCITPFKFHNWGKWEIVGSGEIQSHGSYLLPREEPIAVGRFLNQRRTCADCDLVQERITKSK